jgi:amino acid adenylation domain-containing protein
MARDAGNLTAEGSTVHRLFEQQAGRTPDAVAVSCGPDQLTYAELDARANRLAAALRSRGLTVGGVVAVSMGRTPDLIASILAVLKAGGVYVPLEPSAPEALLRHVMTTAKPFAVLTVEAHRVRLADATAGVVLCLDGDAAEIERQPASPHDVGVGPTGLACVFFTSGSTGQPKGALVSHGNLVSAYQGWQEVFGFSPSDRHLQSTTFEFDVFTADWVRALSSGGTLVLAQRNFTLDRTARIAELHSLILTERITVIGTSVLMARRLTSYLRQIDAGLSTVRMLLIGADKWYLDEQLLLQRHLGSEVRVVNIYGVAEAGIDCSYFDTSAPGFALPEQPARISLIGRPFPGVSLEVLTPDGRPVPVGDPGELRLGGPTVGRGYLGERALTDVRFVPTCFADSANPVPGYRTGDAAILRSDGVLEHLGRIDETRTPQAALELARVDGLVHDQPGVAESVVVDLVASDGSPARVAYVVMADSDPALPAETVRTAVNAELTSTAPTSAPLRAVVPLSALPRTRVGKIDRSGLPLPADEAAAGLRGSGKGFVRRASGKGFAPGTASAAGAPASAGGGTWLVFTSLFSVLALLFTNAFWPGSNDLSLVPQDWHFAFRTLYACEDIAFGLGVTFFFFGRRLLRRLGAPPGRTRLAHWSIVWLLAAWWPQDNSYRTAGADDWGSQVARVYGFNVSLMLAAALVVWFLASTRRVAP